MEHRYKIQWDSSSPAKFQQLIMRTQCTKYLSDILREGDTIVIIRSYQSLVSWLCQELGCKMGLMGTRRTGFKREGFGYEWKDLKQQIRETYCNFRKSNNPRYLLKYSELKKQLGIITLEKKQVLPRAMGEVITSNSLYK